MRSFEVKGEIFISHLSEILTLNDSILFTVRQHLSEPTLMAASPAFCELLVYF